MWRVPVALSQVVPVAASAVGAGTGAVSPGLVTTLWSNIGLDPGLAIAVGLGVPLGIMVRAAHLVSAEKSRSAITRDVVVSVLVSGACFVVAAVGASRFHLGLMEALLASIATSALGVEGLKLLERKVLRKVSRWLGEDDGVTVLPANVPDPAMERLIAKLDEPKETDRG